MRKTFLLLTALLAITGIILFLDLRNSLLSIAHIWGGMFFLVIFPLYALDHIQKHWPRLKMVLGRGLSGLVMLAIGGIICLSGVIMMLYPQGVLPQVDLTHIVSGLLIIISLIVHSRFRK